MRKIYYRIEEITGPVVKINAKNVSYGEIAKIYLQDGSSTFGQVIRLQNTLVSIQVFSGSKGIRTDDKVEFLGRQVELLFDSQKLLGRIFNGIGEPIDKKASLSSEKGIEIAGPSFNPARRIIPSKMIETGIPMIDMFNTLVESQKLPIFSIAGEPYNELLARIASQADADVIIFGGMGLKYDDYLFFKEELKKNKNKTIMFIHTASDPIVECITVSDMSLAAAEKYAVEGSRVLVLLTDMTAFANAMKEVAIAMDQIPSNRGYPGDLYSQLAARYEKAVDIEGLGSITILAVTTMPGDDVTHPVPDNTGYITEGQFYLKNGVVDPFGSLSRLKQLVNSKTRDDHSSLMNAMIKIYDSCRKVRQQMSMGFEISSFDQKVISYGKDFEEQMMDLAVNMPLVEQLDLGWKLLSKHFSPEETSLPSKLIEKYWIN